MPPFQAAVDAGVETFMAAFHDLNGIPCTGSKRILTDLLRNEMGFCGMVVSDAGGVGELENHGYAEDKKDCARLAINAGNDMEMYSDTYSLYLKELVEKGDVSIERLDEAVRRVLSLKDKLGLFEKPYVDLEAAKKAVPNEESLALAREAAQKSIVLLKTMVFYRLIKIKE